MSEQTWHEAQEEQLGIDYTTMPMATRAREIAAELYALADGRGDFEQVRGLFCDRGAYLAEYAMAAIGEAPDGEHWPNIDVTMAEIVRAAQVAPDALNDWAAELASRLPPAVTLRIAGALLRALDDVPP